MITAPRSDSAARYAIYWAPPGDCTLSHLGAAWLGRDAATDRRLDRPAIDGFSEEALAAITAEPRRYGLHATLKPPFRLAQGRSAAELEAALARFAAQRSPVALPALRLKRIGRFIALAPRAREAAIDALAAAAVEAFDGFRAPADAAELARRRAARLTPAQQANVARWGYPYVMEEFRFHVTLTGPLDDAVAARLEPPLAALFAPAIAAPPAIAEIALFIEPEPGAPFLLARRFALGPEER
ncbi:MAG TPA: DUF1045 domain-containing protein [Stellaceae bacterium]|nr:DUF1045 domain-containing protein [Stellaceae bacterium]